MNFQLIVVFGVLLMLGSVNAIIVEMFDDSSKKCSNGLLQDVDNIVLRANVNLERDVVTSDSLVFEITEPPDNKFNHYFQLNLKYQCKGYNTAKKVSCEKTNETSFTVIKTGIASAQRKGAKARFFITGEWGTQFSNEIQLQQIYQNEQSDDRSSLIINDERLSNEENITTIYDKELKLQFDCTMLDQPCFITLKINGSNERKITRNQAILNLTYTDGGDITLNIVYAGCREGVAYRNINHLIKLVNNETNRSDKKSSVTYATSPGMFYIDEENSTYTPTCMPEFGIIIIIAVTCGALVVGGSILIIIYCKKRMKGKNRILTEDVHSNERMLENEPKETVHREPQSLLKRIKSIFCIFKKRCL